jgi:transcriptional regulator with XRE-family HTH domain
MNSQSKLIQIRSRKLGVLIFDSRQASRRTVEECADAVGVTPEEFAAFESGNRSPSMPQIEMLAIFLNVPLDHFWGQESLSKNLPEQPANEKYRILMLRNRVIGASLRLNRDRSGLSLEDLSAKLGIPSEELKQYEVGETAVPLPQLERLADVLNIPIPSFYDQHGPISKWRSLQGDSRKFTDLSPELQQFVNKPVNQPYLEIAKRLSEMPVDKLRALAESLLDITY